VFDLLVGIYADGPNIPTAYGKVARYIGRFLRKHGHEIAFCSTGFVGNPLWFEDSFIYPGADAYCIAAFIRKVKPDVLLTIRDTWIFLGLQNHPPVFYDLCKQSGVKHILYSPVHTDMVPEEFVNEFIRECDYALTMTKWSRDVMFKHGCTKIDYLYHGVDTSIYRPRKSNLDLPHPLIVSIGTNIGYRKNFPALLLAFKKLLEQLDCYLYLHTSVVGYYQLKNYLKHLGIANKVIFPQDLYQLSAGFTEEQMSDVLNAADVYVNAAFAEGFDMPSLEALACGKPVVVTDFPVHREILGDYAIYPTTSRTYPTTYGFEWMIDADDLATKLYNVLSNNIIYKDPTDYIKQFTWDNVLSKLLDILGSL
jgi:glycosyltransferase involved in cell wall biosynthesis